MRYHDPHEVGWAGPCDREASKDRLSLRRGVLRKQQAYEQNTEIRVAPRVSIFTPSFSFRAEFP